MLHTSVEMLGMQHVESTLPTVGTYSLNYTDQGGGKAGVIDREQTPEYTAPGIPRAKKKVLE